MLSEKKEFKINININIQKYQIKFIYLLYN